MSSDRKLTVFKAIVTGLGALGLLYACLGGAWPPGSPWILAVLLTAVAVSPFMSITLRHAGATLSFSDAVIFSSFLFGLGEWAVLLAALEVLAGFLFLKWKRVEVRWRMLPLNIGLSAAATSLSLTIVQTLPGLAGAGVPSAGIEGVLRLLTALALLQFLFTSAFTAAYYSIAAERPFLSSWKEHGLPLSVTHFAGAAFAGLAFVIWRSGDFMTGVGTLLVLAVMYLSYRQIVSNMQTSLEAATRAEHERAEAERQRRSDTEKYVSELTTSLLRQEAASRALSKSENAFRHAAMHDGLTRLPNRTHFVESLKTTIQRTAARNSDDEVSDFVFLAGLSRFKRVNDTLGRSLGDRTLEVAAMRIGKLLPHGGFAARIGGDEFAVIVPSLEGTPVAEEFARRLHAKLSEPISIEGNRINIGLNLGVVPLTSEYKFPEEVLRDADIAMRFAGERQTGIELFNSDIRDASLHKARTESELPRAIENKEFFLEYQPLVSLVDGSLIGVEALVRWAHPERGTVPPGDFIPIAEETGLIIPMTSWILDEACRDLAILRRSAARNRDLVVSVNISGRHLSHQSIAGDVRRSLEEAGLSPWNLKLEVTETVAMHDAEQSILALNELKELGVQLSIDDFGTGYSSLSHLHRLPFDTLKIDRSFVKNVGENGENSEILGTIISLAKSLRMRVIAEGVETVEQLGLLRSMGCDYAQGFLMSRPVGFQMLGCLMEQKSSWLPRPGTPDPQDPAGHGRPKDNVIPLA